MEKMRFKTKDLTDENVKKIGELFPEVITEGKVNFDKLKQVLSKDIVDGDECYDFTWVGKKEAGREANRPTTKTLRPCKKESVNFDTTENLYIEGDNLEVLKILQESYLGKIKMIYIDPPYNTGNDFIYNDDFKMNNEEYAEETGEVDEEGNRLFRNTDSNGRFHSDWCSMMYSRLKLARNLLSDDGVIFISIDDNEVDNLRKICDEVFGEENFVGNICWQKKTQPSFLSKKISTIKEHILFYFKKDNIKTMGGYTDENKLIELLNISNIKCERILKKESVLIKNGEYSGKLNKGVYGNAELAVELKNSINVKDGKTDQDLIVVGRFKWTQESINKSISEGDVYHIKSIDSLRPTIEKYNKQQNIKPILDLLSKKLNDEIPTNTDATNEIKIMFDGYGIMDFPKPTNLIKYLLRAVTYENKDSIVCDFFSGSATTAHAVMKLNAEDGGNRKFIMVQLPEECAKDSEAYKAGYKNICEIGKERICRAGKQILKDMKDSKTPIEKMVDGEKKELDVGFRVLKLDESNMKDVHYNPEEYTQDLLSKMTSNIKEDRTIDDLLFSCLLESGVEINKSYRTEKIDGFNVIIYNEEGEVPEFVACFDEKVSEKCIKEIANMKPLKAVFRDSSFATTPSKINIGEIFKMSSPKTVIKVM